MDVNLGLKIPALEQLLKMAASGVGAVAGPVLARWKARAQADALRIEAGGKADAMGLIASAQAEAGDKLANIPASARTELEIRQEIEARLSFQEEKRQRNIESVVRQAAEELGEKEVDAADIDHDWTAAFFADVQDVSSVEMQQIWAKILAGEVERPGTTSIQTLSVLKIMSKRDAELFQNVARFAIGDFIINEERVVDRLSDFPNYVSFMRLESLNLVQIGPFLSASWENKGERFIDDHDIVYRVYNENRSELNLSISIYALSYPGREIYRIIKPDKHPYCLGEFARHLQKHGAKLAGAEILSRDEDGGTHHGPWTVVEPRLD